MLRDTARAMSQETLEIVRTLYEALNDRDWDRFAEVCDPGVELRGTIGGLEEDTVALCGFSHTWRLRQLSKRWGCRSKALTPTPEPAKAPP